MRATRTGSGKPLLLVHGLGGSAGSWQTIAPELAKARALITLILPGHGGEPAESDSGTFNGLVGSVETFLKKNELIGVDMVGSSMGARIVLELARRGLAGHVVALDPGGFWQGWERTYFKVTIGASVKLLRLLKPALAGLSKSTVTRALLLLQLTARPGHLVPDVVAEELTSFADTPTFDELVSDLANGPPQIGPAASNTGKISIIWGRNDRLCLPRQAARATSAFPSADLIWLDNCGHFPMWDQPEKTVKIILGNTG